MCKNSQFRDAMYFTTLPDHTDPNFDEQLHFSRFGKSNIIFNARSNQAQCDDHVGCLSLKTMLEGEEWYGIGSRTVSVRPGQLLMLNDGQSYSCRIDVQSARTLSIFFAVDFARSLFHNFSSTPYRELDDPFHTGTEIPEFFQSLHAPDESLAHALASLVRTLDETGYDSNAVDEQLISVFAGLLRLHRRDITATQHVHAIKASTRKEIYRRLCIARDVMQSCHREKLDLAIISALSSLSVPQLVKQFNHVFGTTPHQYLTTLRLNSAKDLLQTTQIPVRDIAIQCGFDSAGSFCRVFRKTYQASPGALRKMNSHPTPIADSSLD